MHTVGEAQMSTFREVIDDAIGKESQIIGSMLFSCSSSLCLRFLAMQRASGLTCIASEMFEILGRSGLDEDLLAWVWEHTSTVTFVTVGPQANDDGTFSREQGIVALYLAQAQAGLEPSDFSKKLMPSHNFSAACMLLPIYF